MDVESSNLKKIFNSIPAATLIIDEDDKTNQKAIKKMLEDRSRSYCDNQKS